ncbi:hypothetical protein [Clostridium beijerinckii]|uniref:hypothetical protein n=1 Tax=Clostridium beijerinckii TaxID=1520 RepID=UPI0013610593|nr:hypothetical protein [Clostridium beijerinckii]MZK53516.1 hypothetical protein [Clostridium beijerinckii]MZK60458.1 hypothetical protein [Clostridium beijerinckii]MZK70275.1 hypothetical protein [Clostridium beijerinckii]MZK76082.1 hypothetical protein [Clostridium beijerinckii]MZK85186.1 hypothetical protein [Clostridium beijerinckii]
MAVVKAVSFKAREQNLVDFIGDRDFSYYVKELIKKDMRKEKSSEPPNKIEKVAPKKRNVNFDI